MKKTEFLEGWIMELKQYINTVIMAVSLLSLS